MKEATGELNMTVVTIVLIGVITVFFSTMWPTIKSRIEGGWKNTDQGLNNFQQNQQYTPH